MSRRLIQVGTLVSHASSSDHTKEVDGTPKLKNSKWATADGKRGAAILWRRRLPKGVLREHLAIKKRRFPPRPCSGIDSAVAGPWQHADVSEEKAANSVLLRRTEGARGGVAYRDMTAMHPADNTDDRAAVSPARRQAFWLVTSSLRKSALSVVSLLWAITCGGRGGEGLPHPRNLFPGRPSAN